MGKEERCYLCCWAYKLVEHPDNKYRKYMYMCRWDHKEHAPCSSCELFQEQTRRDKDGRTHSLEENY